jgi:hypothetical protein
VFGGPVTWRLADAPLGDRAVTGSDRRPYQLGAGVAFDLPHHLDLGLEAAAIGEQGLVLGAGYTF